MLQYTWYITVWTDTLCYSILGCGMVQFGLTHSVIVYLVGVCYSLDCHTLLQYTWFWYGTVWTDILCLLQYTWLWYGTVGLTHFVMVHLVVVCYRWTDTLCYSTTGCGLLQFGQTYLFTVHLVGVCYSLPHFVTVYLVVVWYSLDWHTLLQYTWLGCVTVWTDTLCYSTLG